MNLCAFFASICAPELTLGKVSAHEKKLYMHFRGLEKVGMSDNKYSERCN